MGCSGGPHTDNATGSNFKNIVYSIIVHATEVD